MPSPARVVLDTDAFNEVDDQFALVYALQSMEMLRLEAVYAAPFHNDRSSGPADGMEKSYDEILRLLDLMGKTRSTPALRGATAWLTDHQSPSSSDAVNDLISRALTSTEQDPLYVVGIAAATNLAAALLLEPRIVRTVRYIWLGGQPLYWHSADEFNLRQDIRAAQVLFDSGVDLLHVPCKNVAEHLRTSPCELSQRLPRNSKVSKFLLNRFEWYQTQRGFDTKPLWDIAALACLTLPESVSIQTTPSPRLSSEKTWIFPTTERHPIKTVTELKRDMIYRDLFAKLATCP